MISAYKKTELALLSISLALFKKEKLQL